MKPYEDSLMTFEDGMYILTEEAVLNYGIDLREWLAANKAANPETLLQNILYRASEQIYNLIYSYTAHDEFVRHVLACLVSARKVLYRALLLQVDYLKTVGYLGYSTNKEERALRVSDDARELLGNRIIPEIGRTLLYTGV